MSVDVLDSLDLTMDENKENQTPEDVQQQGELDWVQQYSLDQEREEQELQQALAQSLQEHVGSHASPTKRINPVSRVLIKNLLSTYRRLRR